jgi:serine phosphatase RsbU (regulator of sigma subunit)
MRISFKLLLFSELVLLAAIVALLVPVRAKMREQVVADMQNELHAIAATAALQIDGDLHKQVHGPDGDHERAFAALCETLTRIRDANRLPPEHIYTFYRDRAPADGQEIVRFAVMTHAEPFVGDAYTYQPGMRDVFERGKTHVTELYKDQHGEWISAYAPIRDSTGEVVGLLEVDRNSREYFARYHTVTLLNVILGLVALALSSLLGYVSLERIVIRPMRAVRDAMVALSRNDFRHRVRLDTRDEFQDLGETLNGLSEQFNVARKIQSSFYPERLPTHPDYKLAAQSIPCDATGGDYFDAFTLPGGKIAVLVADVSGHGLGPSLLMSACRSALRALCDGRIQPGELVDRLDQALENDLVEGRFITLIFGVLDAAGRFTYTNAGHGPALLAGNGRVQHFEPHRPPLGIRIPGDAPVQSTIEMRRGDRLLLASDGLTEAMDPSGEMLGVERVEQILRDRSVSCDVVVTRLNEEMERHCAGRTRSDDVTILCVDRL